MRLLTSSLAVMTLTFSALAQPVCAPLWMTFDLAAAEGSTPEEVYFWVTPLNGLAVISADGVVDVPAGGTLTTETQACLNAGCYFVGLETAADWWPSVDVVTDDMMWSVSEPEPMYEQNDLLGFTFCVENNFADCEVELSAELGVGPNGAYLFEAATDSEGAIFTWSVNGSILAEGAESELEWYNMLGVPWWEVCVMMVTADGCGAMDCMNSSDFEVGGCIDELLIDPNMGCFEIWAPVCGCDGVTYSNSCHATYYGGVTSFEQGECSDSECIDETLIDPNAICPLIWNPVCGCNGVTYGNPCEAENFGGVTEYTLGECGQTGSCDPVIEAWPSDVPGVWNFLAYDASNPSGQPLPADVVDWYFNGEIVGTGADGSIQVAYWGTNDYLWVGCASILCLDVVSESCWEWPNPGEELECENVVVAVNAEWDAASGSNPLELELVLSMADVELDYDLSQLLQGGSFFETLSFCLPVGYCYELEAAVGNLNSLDVGLLEIAAGVGQELPAWQDVLSALNGPDAAWSVLLGVDVLEDCEDETSLVASSEPVNVKAFPNPATETAVFSGWEREPVDLVLRNMLGQTLLELQTVFPGDAIVLPETCRGVVQAELVGNGWTARQTLVVN